MRWNCKKHVHSGASLPLYEHLLEPLSGDSGFSQERLSVQVTDPLRSYGTFYMPGVIVSLWL